MKEVVIGDCRLILGDALEFLPTLAAGSVDAVVTDPPYGVNFHYQTHNDTPVGYREWCGKWFRECQRISAGPIGISCGIANLQDWPKADWVICWYKPAAMGRCFVGFNNWEPVLLYGKCRSGQIVDVFRAVIKPDPSLDGHPCPKPTLWGVSLVNLLTCSTDLVCDPFMGSGTTAVACIQTGRKFIGCEIDPAYFDIAVQRVREAQHETGLFATAKPKPPDLFAGVETRENEGGRP